MYNSWHSCVASSALDTKKTTRKPRTIVIIIISIVFVAILLLLIAVIISCAVYQYRKRKDMDKYGPVSTKEPDISLDTLKNKINKKPSQQFTTDSYPEQSATP